MAMDAKQRKTLMIRIGAGLALVFAVLFLGWFMFWPSTTAKPRETPLNPSDPMVPAAPQKVQLNEGGRLTVNPTTLQFNQDKPDNIVFVVRADGAPVTIQDITIPQTEADTLKIQNIDCPNPPAQLVSGSSCTLSLTWNGNRSVSSAITINAATVNTSNVVTPIVQNIAVTAVSTKPPVAANAAPGAPGADGTTPAPAGAPNTTQTASGPSPMQQQREAYLQGRRGAGVNVVTPGQLMPVARSPYASWDNIGVQGSKSSFPVDMSRVITPDKPITAVLTYQIDTRQTVTAVAMVDRDVYGNNGRTVVIPRGTKIVGKVGGGATDRVGIAWSQLIRPDGVRFVFEGESGDAMGRGGVPGKINNRYLERYGYSLLPSLVSAGITAALGGQTSSAAGVGGGAASVAQTQDAKAVAAQIIQQPLTQIAQDIYRTKSQIPVQITIPAGTRLTVWSTGDLRLKPVGEEEQAANQQNGQQGTVSAFGPVPQRQQGQSAYAQQPQAQAQTQPAPAQAAETSSGGSSLQVGRVDANGNYIAPGSTAPAPGPIVTNDSNGSRTTVSSTPTGTAAKTTFPAPSNPWK